MRIVNTPTSISKKIFWQYINRRVKTHYKHVFSIVSILFDELKKDLIKGEEINIFNFGTLQLVITKPRVYHHVRLMCNMKSKGGKVLRFVLYPEIRDKLCGLIDIDKTFVDSEDKK
jgi:nucleoid DNA-binding protein